MEGARRVGMPDIKRISRTKVETLPRHREVEMKQESSDEGLGAIAVGGIRSARQSAGLKLSELARASAIPILRLKQLERGLAAMRPAEGKSLAPYLGVNAKALMRGHLAFIRAATPGEGYTTAVRPIHQVTAAKQKAPANKLRVLDIFCGAGGLSYGFEATGDFVTVGGIDLLSDRIDTFLANHPFAVGIATDIRKLSPMEVHRLVGPVDVVAGGPPCQGFSSIRPFRTLTEGDPRNSLAEHFVLMIAGLQPRWFVFENVLGLLTHEGGAKLEALLGGFRAAGYRAEWRIMNAAAFGVPQHRERIVIIGNREDMPIEWPRPKHCAKHRSMAGQRAELIIHEPLFDGLLPPPVTVVDAIGDLPQVAAGGEVNVYRQPKAALTDYQRSMRTASSTLTWHRATAHSAKMLEIIKHAGASIRALPRGMVTSGFSSCYSRLDANKPSTTITVNFVHPASNRCIHPTQHRALTVREGARLQSFPDRFQFVGTVAQVVKQIGNAVPPRLGSVIAGAISASEAGHAYGRNQTKVGMCARGQRAASK